MMNKKVTWSCVALGILLIVTACKSGVTYSDSTLTVVLTGYAAGNTHDALYAVVADGDDPLLPAIIASGQDTITGGDVSILADAGLGGAGMWTGTGGTYDLYFWVDLDDDMPINQFPESGVDSQASTYPVSILIDGNVTVTFTGADIVVAP